MWWHSKTQIVIKFKNSNCDETQKVKLWINSRTQIVTKKEEKKWQNSNCDKTQNVTKLKTQNSIKQTVTKKQDPLA